MRFYFLVFLIFPFKGVTQQIASSEDTMRVEIIKNAEKYLGMNYRSKVEKNVLDCSGYVKYLFASIKKNITRSSVSQIHDGKRVDNIKNARPGDVLIFKGRNPRNNRPGHVGLFHHRENDVIYFIHSSVSKGICIDRMDDPYYKKRFLQIRNVISGS